MKKLLTYDDAKLRLEEIIEAIQSNRLTIDELTAVIEEAVKLVDFCKQRLRQTEEKVDKILAAIDEK